jgi:CRP-like cAMP-binding protein
MSRNDLETTCTNTHNFKIKILKKWDMLSDLSDDDLLELADLSELCNIEKDTFIYREGDEPHYLYIIIDGKIQSFSSALSGRIIGGNVSKDIIGMNGIISGQPRWLSARAKENLITLKVRREDLITYLLQRPVLQMRFLIEADKLLCILSNKIKSSWDCSAQQRVVDMLYGFYEKFGPLLSFKMEEIANHTGLTRETTIRAMSLLRKKGVIEVNRHGIKIKDAEELRLLKLYAPQI